MVLFAAVDPPIPAYGHMILPSHTMAHSLEITECRVDVAEFVDWATACGMDPVEAIKAFLKRRWWMDRLDSRPLYEVPAGEASEAKQACTRATSRSPTVPFDAFCTSASAVGMWMPSP